MFFCESSLGVCLWPPVSRNGFALSCQVCAEVRFGMLDRRKTREVGEVAQISPGPRTF
jgi:hypothetical protein